MAEAARKSQRTADLLLAALVEQPTVAAAAVAIGVSERTAYRYASDPAFAEQWQRVRRQRVESALEDVQDLAREAVAALRRNLNSGKPSVEVRAAAAVLDLGVRAYELLDLARRVEELEALKALGLQFRARR